MIYLRAAAAIGCKSNCTFAPRNLMTRRPVVHCFDGGGLEFRR
jgi:hypothetical protein